MCMEYRNIYLQDLGTKSSTSDNDVIEFHFIFTIYTQRRISLGYLWALFFSRKDILRSSSGCKWLSGDPRNPSRRMSAFIICHQMRPTRGIGGC